MESELNLVAAEIGHVWPIVAFMRDLDAEEIRAAVDVDPAEALVAALEVPDSEIWTLLADQVPVAMGGVTKSTSLPGWGIVWLVGTDWITEHPLSFTRYMQDILAEQLDTYYGLYNWVDSRNRPAREWLETLGFTIMDPAPFGPKEMDFHYFWIRSPQREAA